MITDEKIAAIRKLLRRGEPEGEIREALAREGYAVGERLKKKNGSH